MKTLACIHTSLVFINVETMMNDLFKELLPDVRRVNIVDDSLLADTMKAGQITPAVAKRMVNYVQMAEAAGADVILSLCSSLGPAIDLARPLVQVPVIKIDDAMADTAARQASRIGVIATVGTTLGPTVALVREKAAATGKEPSIRPLLVEGAFEILLRGERERHDEMVSAGAGQLAGQVDLLVCAQASMTRLAPRLAQETGKPVLSSPRLAIEFTRKVLEQLG
jgi:Asp/Glu/hydantoin racemase